jgi:hypothetical protein
MNCNKLFAIFFTSGLVLIINPMKVSASLLHHHRSTRADS